MKLSIITINYNNAEGLRKTLASVAAQTYRNIEHIIVDGGSTDGSVDVIREYENTIKRSVTIEHPTIQVKWSSEPDRGIYNAMNKGIEIAIGHRVVNALNRSELVEDKNKELSDYLYFLNSGDALASDSVLERMTATLDGSDFIVGRVNSWLNGVSIGLSPLHTEKDYTMYNMFLNGINHQSVLIRRELQEQQSYDTKLKICGDWKFFVQSIVVNNATIKNVDIVFADFDRSGVSSNGKALIQERLAILKDVLPPRIAEDYLKVLPNYYEVIRITWLIEHPFFYRIYRAWTTFGRKLLGDK
ncbi:MAG: glycosyltransferase family 2 protein [Paludibacteraceae bacterium]